MSEPRKRRPSGLFAFLMVGLAAVIIVLLVRSQTGTAFGLANQDFARMAYLAAILVFLASALAGRALRPGEITKAILGWGGVFILAVGIYSYRGELAGVGGRLLGALAPGIPLSGRLAGAADGNSVVIVRAPDGHFAVRGSVDGKPITFLVDTGASFVTLTHDDATMLGINADGLDYSVPIRTANGPMSAAATRIDRLAIGPIERRDIRALVAPNNALDQSLLGMTFLDTLTSYAISGDRLVMTP
jgi:aspartyl protease family protein